ncbi:MAG: adenosine kinase [Actinobacteria bacterium]|nr:adenosine kinase [Actinomycetota bacterium]
MKKEIDVTGIGNAIVDIMTKVDEEFLETYGFKKGSMTLIDEQMAEKLYSCIMVTEEVSGGSAANTIAGLASLGRKVAFIGKVKNDILGNSFDYGLNCIGVQCKAKKVEEGLSTARCIIFVTPDAQRTMCTFLGVAGALNPEDIEENKYIISNSRLIYLEGYLWDRPEAKLAIKEAVKIARESGSKIAFSLSDSFCVQRHRSDFLELIRKDIDIVFANENEIMSLFEENDFESSIKKCRKINIIWALTRSEKGSIIVSKDNMYSIKIDKVENLTDTTGAGDLYAAGFLHGFLEGRDLITCGRMGSIAASEIISHYGARPRISLTELFRVKSL